MPLSQTELENIRADCFAEDVEIPPEATLWWAEADAEQYFNSGGTDMPSPSPPPGAFAAATDPALPQLLESLQLAHLSDALHGETADGLGNLERSALLARLKSRGLKLSESQKLATALIKRAKAASVTPVAPAVASAVTPAFAPAVTPAVAPAVAPAHAIVDVSPPAAPTGMAPTDAEAMELSDPALRGCLDSTGLSHLGSVLHDQSVHTLSSFPRPELLGTLKTLGVTKLHERQKLATALAKLDRAKLDHAKLDYAHTKAPADEVVNVPYGGKSPWVPPTAEQLATLPRPCGALRTALKIRKPDLKTVMARRPLGEHYGLPFPHTPAELRQMGAEWLTRAFHRAGTLPASVCVSRVTTFRELFPGGDPNETRGDGGAALKVLLDIEYAGPAEAVEGLHTALFVKLPLPCRDDNESFFLSCELHMDFPEVMYARVFAGAFTACGVGCAKYYFGEYARESASFVLITERLPFGTPSPSAPPLTPFRLGSWREHCASLKGASRAAAYPLGSGSVREVVLDSAWQVRSKWLDDELPHRGACHYEACAAAAGRLVALFHTMNATVLMETLLAAPGPSALQYVGGAEHAGDPARHAEGVSARGDEARKAASGLSPAFLFVWGRGVEFATKVCPQLFPADLRARLPQLTEEVKHVAQEWPRIAAWLATPTDVRLGPCFAHSNLMTDNAFYWQSEEAREAAPRASGASGASEAAEAAGAASAEDEAALPVLEAGLFDWGGATINPNGPMAMLTMLLSSAPEPEVAVKYEDMVRPTTTTPHAPYPHPPRRT